MLPEHIRKFVEMENVHSVGRSTKDENTLIVRVEEKVSMDDLLAEDRVPPKVSMESYTWVTDVVEEPKATAEQTREERHERPVPAGISIGHEDVTAGTLGSVPVETDIGDTVVITNAHIAPAENGDVGDTVLQPGPGDGGDINDEDDHLGTVYDYIDVYDSEDEIADAAYVEVDGDVQTNYIYGIGGAAGIDADTNHGGTFYKSGRTTGVTSGDRTETDVTTTVDYDGNVVTFNQQDRFDYDSDGGDSGSIVGYYDSNDEFQMTNLHFAASDTAVASPLANVETELGSVTVLNPDSLPVFPDDWTMEWETEDGDFYVHDEASDEGDALLKFHTEGNARYAMKWDDAGEPSDVDVIAAVEMEKADPSAGFSNARVIVRGGGDVGSERGYFTEFRGTDGNERFALRKYVGGSISTLNDSGPAGGTFEATKYLVRLEADGDEIRAKHWEYGTSEPSAWDIEVVDEDLGSGWVGLGSYTDHMNEEWDYFSIGTFGESAVAPDLPDAPLGVLVTDSDGNIQTTSDGALRSGSG